MGAPARRSCRTPRTRARPSARRSRTSPPRTAIGRRADPAPSSRCPRATGRTRLSSSWSSRWALLRRRPRSSGSSSYRPCACRGRAPRRPPAPRRRRRVSPTRGRLCRSRLPTDAAHRPRSPLSRRRRAGTPRRLSWRPDCPSGPSRSTRGRTARQARRNRALPR